MKRFFFSAFAVAGILLLTLSTAHAQTTQDSGKKFHIGVKAGLNLADAYGDDVDDIMSFAGALGVDKQVRVGAVGGLFMSYAPISWFSIQPELLYSQKGVKLEWFGAEAVAKLDYIEIPVLAKLNIPIGAVKPNIFVGPAFAFNIVARGTVDVGGTTVVSGSLKDAGADIEAFDFGLVFGGGVDFEVGSVLVTLDGRYTLGLTEVVKDVDIKNGVASIMAGIGF